MRIDQRNLRLLNFFIPWIAGPRFLRKGGTLQAQETALIVSGYLRRLWMPLFDIIFHPLLSEWTTITIPYSRIRWLRFRRFWVWRSVLTALAWTPCAILAFLGLHDPALLIGALFLGALAVVLSLYVNLMALSPRFHLSYLTADAKTLRISFRIRNAKVRQDFHQFVDDNRQQARSHSDTQTEQTDADPAGAGRGWRRRPGSATRKLSLLALFVTAPWAAPAWAGAKDDVVLKQDFLLAATDPVDPVRKTNYQKFAYPMTAGKSYCIDLKGPNGIPIQVGQVHPLLILRDPTGKQVDFDVDSGGKQDARIIHKATQTGPYEIIATSFLPGQTGKLTLQARPAVAEDWRLLWTARSQALPKISRGTKLQHVQQLQVYLAERGVALTEPDVLAAQAFARALEANHRDLALMAYTGLGLVTAPVKDAAVARWSPLFRNAMRRLDANRRNLSLKSKTIDGKAFDLDQLRGKVVLIRCTANVGGLNAPDAKALASWGIAFGSSGLKIIEANLSADRAFLEAMLAKDRPPWPILYEDLPAGAIFSPLAEHLGAWTDTTYILLDRELHIVASGTALASVEPALAAALGPVPGTAFPMGGVNPQFPRPKGVPPGAGAMPTADSASLLIIGGIILAVLTLFGVCLAVQAHQRGHNFVVWLLAAIFAMNPLLPLVLLGLLPNRRRQQLRVRERQWVQDRMTELAIVEVVPIANDGSRSRTSSTTQDWPGRSIGDDETRL